MDERILALAKARYISLTTYRRDGRVVATPFWFALDGTRILVWTGAASGKAKRIRANGRAAIAPCNARGKTTRQPFAARARMLPETEFKRADRILSAKYRLAKPLIAFLNRLNVVVRGKQPSAPAFIELQLSDGS